MTVTTNGPAQGALRLKLDSGPSRKAALDGAWWPRTTDAEAELPSLLEALGGSRGQITHVLLGATEWDVPHRRRLGPGRAAARLGWYTSQPAGVVTIMTEFGRDRFDLLVVPPGHDTGRGRSGNDLRGGRRRQEQRVRPSGWYGAPASDLSSAG
jgi:hypothetical protein